MGLFQSKNCMPSKSIASRAKEYTGWRIVAAEVDAVGPEPSGEFRIVIHEERDRGSIAGLA